MLLLLALIDGSPSKTLAQHPGSVFHSLVPDNTGPAGAGLVFPPHHQIHSFLLGLLKGSMQNQKDLLYSPHRNNLITVKTTSSIPAVESAHFCLLNVRSLANKSFICQDFIMTNNIDFFIITESWINPDECAPLIESSPPEYPINPINILVAYI